MEYLLCKYLKPEKVYELEKKYNHLKDFLNKHFYEKTTYVIVLAYMYYFMQYLQFFHELLSKLLVSQDFSIATILFSSILPMLAFFTSTGSRKLNDIAIRLPKFRVAYALAMFPLFVLLCQSLYFLFVPGLISFMYPKIAYRYATYGYSAISYNDTLFLAKSICFYLNLFILIKIYHLSYLYFESNGDLQRWVIVFVVEDIFITLNGGRRAFADLLIGVGFKNGLNLVLSEVDRFLGTLIIGSTGTGKTSSLAKPFLVRDLIKKSIYLRRLNRILLPYLNDNRISIKDKVYVVSKCSKLERNQFGLKRKFPTEYMARFYITKEVIGNAYHIFKNKKNGTFYIEIKKGFLKYVNDSEEKYKILDIAGKEYKDLESAINAIYDGYKEYFSEYEILDYTNKYYIELNNIEYSGSKKEQEALKKEISEKISIYKGNIGVTVVEPKGDLVVDLIKLCEFFGIRSTYVDPRDPYTENFNILQGNHLDATNILLDTLKTLMDKEGGQDQFFALNQEYLGSSLTQLIKLLSKDDCSIRSLHTTIKKISRLESLVTELQIQDEDNMHVDLIESFTEKILAEGCNIKNHALGLELQLDQLLRDDRLNRVLIPQEGKPKTFDADDHFEYGGVLGINTAYGDLNKTLSTAFGVMAIKYLQSVIFRRKGTEDDRIIHNLLIDEFPQYVNEDFATLFEMGRSYRVATTILCQTLSQLIINGNEKFKDIALTTGTHILYGRCSHKDAAHFMDAFGEKETRTESSSINRTSSLVDEPQIREGLEVAFDIKTKFTQDGLLELPFQLCIVRAVRNSNIIPAKVVRVKFPSKKYFTAENDKNLLTSTYEPNNIVENFTSVSILLPLFALLKKSKESNLAFESDLNNMIEDDLPPIIEDDLPIIAEDNSNTGDLEETKVKPSITLEKQPIPIQEVQVQEDNPEQDKDEDSEEESVNAPAVATNNAELNSILETIGINLNNDSEEW